MVYVVTDGTAVKIGCAVNVKRRLSELSVGNPRKIDLVRVINGDYCDESDYELERALHKLYSAYRINGEWFSTDILPDVLDMDSSKLYSLALRLRSRDLKPLERNAPKDVSSECELEEEIIPELEEEIIPELVENDVIQRYKSISCEYLWKTKVFLRHLSKDERDKLNTWLYGGLCVANGSECSLDTIYIDEPMTAAGMIPVCMEY